MALTVGRAAAITAVGWAFMVATLLPPKERVRRVYSSSRTLEQAQLWRLGRLQRVEEHALQALRERERLASMASHDASRGLKLWISPDFDAASRERARAIMTNVWKTSGLDTARVPTLLAIDTSGSWYGSAEFYLPRTAGEPCLVRVAAAERRVAKSRTRTMTLDLDDARNMLGPCAFYAAFGMPGPAIQEWLLSRGAQLGRAGLAPARLATGQEPPPSFIQRPSDDATVLACYLGNDVQCSTFFRRQAGEDLYLGRRRVPGWVPPTYGHSGSDVLLSDLMNSVGRDTFGKFWRSTLPLDSAFKSAFGTSSGTWTGTWLRRAAGWQLLEVHADSVIVTLITAALLTALGAVVATRRQVGV